MKTGMRKVGLALKSSSGFRAFAAAAAPKGKKGPKGSTVAASAAPTISKELKATTVVGANILKDGADPVIKPDSEYSDWLWHLLDKRPPLSELERKDPNSMPLPELQRFVKLDNRRRIRELNASKAKK